MGQAAGLSIQVTGVGSYHEPTPRPMWLGCVSFYAPPPSSLALLRQPSRGVEGRKAQHLSRAVIVQRTAPVQWVR